MISEGLKRTFKLPKLGKQPILVLLLLGALFLSGIVNYHHQKLASNDAEAWSLRDRELNVAGYLNVATEMGKLGRWDELQASLEYAKDQHLIDFYSLQEGADLIWFGSHSLDLTKLPQNVSLNEPLRTFGDDGVIAAAVMVGDYKVTIGIERFYKIHGDARDVFRRKTMITELIYFGIIVFLAGLWSLRDISALVRRVRSGQLKNIGQASSMSSESDLFIRGLTGYAQTVSDLEDENLRFGRQVLPSLKKEITSGKKPPYDFNCTMVRTDINNFSVIYNTHNVTEFMATINEFFHEVSNVVARYNGLIHEFVGDEVIFYFKDDDHQNSFAIALSAIRDINAVAERFHDSTMESRGYPFTVKSSLAHGTVRFGPLVNGFSVAGSVLIETVRILSHIHEKDGNVVYYDGVFHPKLKGIIEGVERQRVMLKGFPEEKTLYQYVRHQELAAILSSLSEQNAGLLTYFRSDFDLFIILKDLMSQTKNRGAGVTLKAIQVLRQPFVASSKINFGELLVRWSRDLETCMEEGSLPDAERLLSAVEMLLLNLVPKESLGEEARELLRNLLKSSDSRVAANAVEILTHFEVSVEKRITKAADQNDLRIAANSLVFEGRNQIPLNVVKKLSKMLTSDEAPSIASALYAVGELAKIHRERDLVYYSTQIDFKKLVDSIDTFVQHRSSMVRRQALSAACKVKDTELIERTLAAVKNADSDLVNEEASRYLGPYWPNARLPKAS